MTKRRGLLIILSSPSGAGKSTLARRLMDWDQSMAFSVSATTRAPREGEVDGKHYHFKTAEAFSKMVSEGEMLEYARVFDNQYGSPIAPVEAALADGRDIIFDVDWQGGQQIAASALAADVVSIFVLPPSIAELEQRLIARAQDSAEVVARRMAQSGDEISHWADYDYLIVNDEFDLAFDRLKAIVLAERQKRTRRPDLEVFVKGLNAEFEDRNDRLFS